VDGHFIIVVCGDATLGIESTNPKVEGFDGATMSFVRYLYELAK
jgi:hypothetical protein